MEMRRVATAVLLTLAVVLSARAQQLQQQQSQVVNAIAVIVNDQVITMKDLYMAMTT